MSLVYFIQTSSKPQEAGTASRSKNNDNDNDNESEPIWVNTMLSGEIEIRGLIFFAIDQC